MSASQSDPQLDEYRRLMQADWGEVTVRGTPLTNIDRVAALYGIVHDPYHRAAFARRSDVDLMRICAFNLIEAQQWDKAARAIARVNRMEHEQESDQASFANSSARQAAASADQTSQPEHPQSVPGEPPETRSLSDREIWLRLKELRRRRRAQALKPRPAEPAAEPASEADTRPPLRAAAGRSGRLPFT